MKRRRTLFVLLGVGVLAGLAAAPGAARDTLLYNHSPSVPVGLYLRTDAPPARGAFVTVRADAVAPEAARARGFTDTRDRFLKRIAATAGDRVCAKAGVVSINDTRIAAQRAQDSQGRPLPAWQGCRVLGADDFLLLGDTADSFDGRYWGPVARDAIEGVWRPFP